MIFTPIISPAKETDWAQKYRPQKIEDTVLPKTLKTRLATLRTKQIGPSLLLHGPAGAGKTTAALLLNSPENTFLINCSINRGIETIRELDKPEFLTPMIFGGLRTFIFDEADYLTQEAQASMRGLIEKMSNSSLFVFTANYPSNLIEPLHSRLQPINFDFKGYPDLLTEMIERAMQVLSGEGIRVEENEIKPIVRECFPDMRRVLKRLQFQFGLN